MLNERTALPLGGAEPKEPSPHHAVAGLRLIADFLERFPELPGVYVTIGDYDNIGLQIPCHSGEPEDRFLAVARLAHEADGVTHFHEGHGYGGFFESRMRVGGRPVHVYTAVPERSTQGGGAA